jgi:hypothetical protein
MFLVSKQNLKPLLLGASDTITIVENELEMRKLWYPKVKGVKNSKIQTTEHYKGRFSNTQNILQVEKTYSLNFAFRRLFVKLEKVLL